MPTDKQVSLHGRKVFLNRRDKLVVPEGYVSGPIDGPNMHYTAPNTVAFTDDFVTSLAGLSISDTGATGGVATLQDTGTAGLHFFAKCTDTGVTGAIASGVPNGVYRITSSLSIGTATPAASSKSIVGKHIIWKIPQGAELDYNLRMSARVRLNHFPVKGVGQGIGDRVGLFVGLTDTVEHEVPLYDTGRGGDSGASAISPASDAVGFLWGTGGDTGFRGVAANSGLAGGANDSGDTQVTLTTALPTANKWYTFEMQMRRDPLPGVATLSSDYVCEFYIDGAYKGKLRNPVNQTIPLTPVVSFYANDDTGQHTYTCDIDYVHVSAPRDTGN